MNIRKDFPIFQNNPKLVYLDSTATSQKPSMVIDGVAEYVSSSYANIHRGSYEISEISEKLYEDSKKIVAKHIGAINWKEVIYTANSTYALNILSQSIWRTGLLKAWDTVLVSITEHHANIVSWLILKEDYGINVEFVWINDDYSLDLEDLKSKLNERVKIISLAHVSNTLWEINDLKKVSKILEEKYPLSSFPPQGERARCKPLFIVDGSQSVPHFAVDVQSVGCDAMFFTGHKIFADSGIGVLWAKEELLKQLKPIFSGGGAIWCVGKESFTHSEKLPDKFEPGTPNLSGAVSLLKAFEYVESIGGYERLEKIEHDLVVYALGKFSEINQSLQSPHPNPLLWEEKERAASQTKNIASLSSKGERIQEWGDCVEEWQLHLIGWTNPATRVGVFTFYVEGIHSFDISDYLADHNIAVRAGQHCAEPFMDYAWQKHTCRMSLHIYNTRKDIDRFFDTLEKAINDLK